MLIVNGTTIENVVYNGQDLDKLIYNDVVVFEKSGFNAEQVLIDFDYIRNSDGTYTITDWKGTYQGQESTECIVPNKKEIRLYTKTITSQLKDYYEINYTNSLDLDFQIYGFTEEELKKLEVKISFSNQDIFTYEYFLTKKNNNQTDLTFKLQSVSFGINDIQIVIASGKHIYNKKIIVKVLEWIVEAVPNAYRGFALNANGFYESQNKGINSSYSICKVTIRNPLKLNVYFDCINYGESVYDYGFLSKPGATFSLSATKDNNSLIYYDFYNKNSPDIKTVNYGPVEGAIYVKYIKDMSTHSGNDSLQFKVRLE